MTVRRRAIAAGLLALATAVSGCGLKSEVKDSLASATGSAVNPDTGQPVGTTGGTTSGAAATAGTTTGAAGTGATGTTSGGTTAGSATSGTTGSGGTTTGASGATTGGTGGATTTGIEGNTLNISVLAPLTGASPLPQRSFQVGADKYWANRKVQGRYTVKVHIHNDKYNPNGAVQACRSASKSSFVLVGTAGTDQIQACARDVVLRRSNTPFVSAGVTTNGLEGIPNYFAFSLTYKDQSKLLIDTAKRGGFFKAGDTWALVLSGTPNFEDAKSSMQAAAKAAGLKFEYYAAPKAGGDAAPIASQLAAKGYPVVYFSGQPLYFADLVAKTNNATYAPYWVGPGIFAVNSVAALTCGRSAQFHQKGFYLGPYPGLDRAARVAPGQSFSDDIEMLIYGLMQLVDQALHLVKGPMTREALIAAMGNGAVPGGVFTPAAWRGKTHFGGTAAYMLRSNCTEARWDTFGGPIS